MIKKRCTVYIFLLLAGLSGAAACIGIAYWLFQAKERPTLVYFYAGG